MVMPGCTLFRGLPERSVVWMSHGDYLKKMPEGFKAVSWSENCPTAAIADEDRKIYGVQFHPEVSHTVHGREMIRSFLYDVCGLHGTWIIEDFKERKIREIREKVGEGRVLLGLSGGVDSSVLAALLAEAIGPRLTCVFVDHGFMRKNEGDQVEAGKKSMAYALTYRAPDRTLTGEEVEKAQAKLIKKVCGATGAEVRG